jgi:hypothetical protein
VSDRIKIILAVLFLIAALTLPLVGFAVGWNKWDIQGGLVVMLVTFVLLFLAGGFILFSVKDLTWLTIFLPFLSGSIYSFIPDFIPFSVDDATVTTLGGLLSFALAIRKDRNTPKWILLPLLGAGIYTFFGGTIPGGLDEIIIDAAALLIAGIGARKSLIEGIEE